MAVNKMEKVTLISDKKNQEIVLQTIQGLQNIEVRDLYQESSSNQWVSKYFGESQEVETREAELNVLVTEISEAIQFIEHHGDSKGKNLHLKRKELSLQELESAFDEGIFRQKLTEILDLKRQWEVIVEKKRLLMEDEEWLTGWQYLDVNPNEFQSSKTTFLMGSLSPVNSDSFLTDLRQLEHVYAEEIYQDSAETLLAMTFLKEFSSPVEEICSRYNFSKVIYPYEKAPAEMLKDTKDQLSSLLAEAEALAVTVGERNHYIEELEWAEEVLLAGQQREQVKPKFVQSQYLFVLQGWLPTDDKARFLQTLHHYVSEEDIYVSFEEPTKEEIQKEIPTKLKNHSLVAPFEMLTEMYSLPKYEEVDPTPWFTPFYMVFFGMMVADIGYGLLMLIGTIIASKLMILPRGMTRFVKFFHILAYPSIAWGVIYGSIFGIATPFDPLLSTSEDVITILILSVVFGFIQILVGLFVAANENLKRKDYLGAINDGFAWQGILVGIGIAVLGLMILDNQGIVYAGAAVAVLSAITVIVIPVIQSPSKVKGAAKGAYALYGLTSYIGDLVSYTRLMALGISGGSIAAAFNMLVAFMPPAARFSVGILLIVALHALNIFLTLLSAYVHGARLQYVEFFGKFYSGGGRSFAPLKTAEKYMNIESNKQKR